MCAPPSIWSSGKWLVLQGKGCWFESHLMCIGFSDSAVNTFDVLTQDCLLKILGVLLMYIVNTLASGWFWRFSQKNSSFRLPYQRPSSSADCARELFNSSNGSASLVDCTRKKFFGWGVRIVCDWRHKWSSFRVILVHVAWPRAQPLGQSVSLKFSLETRLESQVFWAFDPLSSISGSKVMI